jgi:Flp pilus assembly protein CpaB
VTGDKRQGSPGISPLRGGSFRRALRAEALRRDELPRTAAPAPAAAGPRRHDPDAVPHEQDQVVTLAPSAPIAVRKVTATGTERRALSRSAPPASRAPQDPF